MIQPAVVAVGSLASVAVMGTTRVVAQVTEAADGTTLDIITSGGLTAVSLAMIGWFARAAQRGDIQLRPQIEREARDDELIADLRRHLEVATETATKLAELTERTLAREEQAAIAAASSVAERDRVIAALFKATGAGLDEHE